MLAKHFAIGLVASTLMAGTALAQSPAPAPAPAPSVSTSSAPIASSKEWRTSKLIGVNVYNESNEKLGSIDELITDQQGKINKVVIGVGGFLGMGQRDIAVNFDQLKFSDTPVPSTVATTSSPAAPAGSTTVGSSSTASSSTMARSTADNWYPDHAVMSGTKDQLKAMPEFKYDTSSK